MKNGQRLFLVNVNETKEKHAGIFWGLIEDDVVITRRDNSRQMRLHQGVDGGMTPVADPTTHYRLDLDDAA